MTTLGDASSHIHDGQPPRGMHIKMVWPWLGWLAVASYRSRARSICVNAVSPPWVLDPEQAGHGCERRVAASVAAQAYVRAVETPVTGLRSGAARRGPADLRLGWRRRSGSQSGSWAATSRPPPAFTPLTSGFTTMVGTGQGDASASTRAGIL